MSALQITRGDSHRLRILVEDDSGPLDLEPFTVRFTARRHANSADAVIEKSTPDDITLGITGEAFVDIAPADTWPIEGYVRLAWDVEITSGTGEVATPASGTLTIIPDVTRAGEES